MLVSGLVSQMGLQDRCSDFGVVSSGRSLSPEDTFDSVWVFCLGWHHGLSEALWNQTLPRCGFLDLTEELFRLCFGFVVFGRGFLCSVWHDVLWCF